MAAEKRANSTNRTDRYGWIAQGSFSNRFLLDFNGRLPPGSIRCESCRSASALAVWGRGALTLWGGTRLGSWHEAIRRSH